MKRVILILCMTFVPTAVGAQEKIQKENTPAAPRANNAAPQSSPSLQPRSVPPQPGGIIGRRRGSMVGYIDDATVESHIRIRFETGLHNAVPDRAEFFYAKCGCYRDLKTIDPPNYDPKAPGPGPGIVRDLNFQQLYLEGQYALTKRFAAFAEVPARWIQPQVFAPPPPGGSFPNHGGLGDLRAGLKLDLAASPDQSFTIQLKAYFPTGSAIDGLGTNHATFEPALLYYQRVSDRLVFESQVGDWHPAGASAGLPTNINRKFSGDVFFYGVGPSYEAYRGDHVRLAPVVELVGWSVRGGFQTATPSDATGINIVNLKIGARATFDPRGSIYAGYGHALTSAGWYNDIVRLEYRYSF